MKQRFFCVASVLVLSPMINAMGEDDPLITKVMLDQLESKWTNDESSLSWDSSLYVGRDLNKIWLKVEGEDVDNSNASEAQVWISHTVSPYWDFNLGLRYDEHDTTWVKSGFQGLAAYFIESDISVFIDEKSRVSMRLDFEKELMLTQKWIVVPEIELELNAYNNKTTKAGSGLSKVETGVRLLYQFKREFIPYLGVHWERYFGNSADFQQLQGLSLIGSEIENNKKSHDVDEAGVVLGIKAWF